MAKISVKKTYTFELDEDETKLVLECLRARANRLSETEIFDKAGFCDVLGNEIERCLRS